MENNFKWEITLMFSMAIFGTVGLFRKYIPWPSGVLACVRGIIGAIFLIIVILIKKLKQSINNKIISTSLKFLLITSGILIGINWITLFEAYNYTSVATATLCYYIAPVFVIIVTPLIFKTKIGIKEYLCVISSFIGITFISGVFKTNFNFSKDIKGVMFALISAVFYASIIIINKFLEAFDPLFRTMVQIGIAGLICLPYSLARGEFNSLRLNTDIIIMVLIVSIVITGVTYTLYFSSISKIDSTTIALFSYIDPVVAVIVSVLILGEQMTIFGAVGAIMIIGSMILNNIKM